jgi:23S rRNA (guanosine2251-2'-O)-methyltransferase
MKNKPFKSVSKAHTSSGLKADAANTARESARGQKGHAHAGKPRREPLRLYGRHAVLAALQNPQRMLRRLWATSQALETLAIALPGNLEVRETDQAQLSRLTSEQAPHQGLVLEAEPLPDVFLDTLLATARKPILVLDHVTDPHNVGAILRSAAAFDVAALVSQDRHSPPESGALAKAASGCLERVPWVRVVNIARALEDIAQAGYWRLGLAGESQTTLSQALNQGLARAPLCLVLGAEGEGLRANVAAHCDLLARLPIAPQVESLNVSNAAAIALYAIYTL